VLRRGEEAGAFDPSDPRRAEAGANLGISTERSIADYRVACARVDVEHRGEIDRAAHRGELGGDGVRDGLGLGRVSDARENAHGRNFDEGCAQASDAAPFLVYPQKRRRRNGVDLTRKGGHLVGIGEHVVSEKNGSSSPILAKCASVGLGKGRALEAPDD
jgi:hypothetical protein